MAVAEIQQPDTSLENRFANYAEQAHPESMPPKEPEAPEPAAPVVAEPPAEPVVVPSEPTELETPVRFEFESFDELAKRLEVPVDALLALKLKTKVDDQEGEYTLADIQKGFQLDKHNQNKSKELSAQQEKAVALQKQYEAYQAQANQHLTNLNALGKYAQEMLNADLDAFAKNPETQNLRFTNPTEYIIQRDNLQMRQQQINAFLGQVNQQSQNQQAQAQQSRQAQIQEVLRNRANIRSEWADEGTFNKDTTAIRDAFLSRGFKAEELPTLLTNPAYLAAADAATRWWNLQKQKPEVTQRVKTAPKLVSGSSRVGTVQPSKMTNLKAQLRANPRDLDTAAAAFSEWATEADKAGM